MWLREHDEPRSGHRTAAAERRLRSQHRIPGERHLGAEHGICAACHLHAGHRLDRDRIGQESLRNPGPSSEPVPSPARSAPAGSPVATVGVGGSFDPGSFTSNVDNPWFPLAPGTTLTYSGTKDGKAARETYRVTNRTKVIHGVGCRVVEDQLFLNGKLGEDTIDYYVQDLAGNVWYFGEDTRILDGAGKVTSTEGTWHSGRDGAVAGIFMEATPIVGHSYAQETYTGHAEDHYEVLSVSAAVTVPYGAFSGVVQTKEWTPLEPDVLDHKFWVRGIGEVREASVSGPLEELVLEKVEHH